MWKKDDPSEARQNAPRPEATPPRTDAPRSRPTGGERATIGRSITIRGEVTGDEDLLIQGKVDGSVDLKQHSVTVGPEGQVKAGISARVVTVEGEVQGDLLADEQVILRSTAQVQGDITAPRVVLEDGATFRGGVDMGDVKGSAGSRSSESRTSSDSGKGASGRSKDTPSGSQDGSGRSEDASSRSKDTSDKAGSGAGKTTGATT